MMDEPRYRKHAVWRHLRPSRRATAWAWSPRCWQRRDWQARLLNGSDYPLPGVVPLIDLQAAGRAALLDAAACSSRCASCATANVLLFDFVLKRSLSLNGQRFAPVVFETAPFFARPG